MLAFAFFVLFAGTLRSHLRRAPSADALSSVVLAGAAVFAAGGAVYFSFDFALTVVPSHLALNMGRRRRRDLAPLSSGARLDQQCDAHRGRRCERDAERPAPGRDDRPGLECSMAGTPLGASRAGSPTTPRHAGQTTPWSDQVFHSRRHL